MMTVAAVEAGVDVTNIIAVTVTVILIAATMEAGHKKIVMTTPTALSSPSMTAQTRCISSTTANQRLSTFSTSITLQVIKTA